jgi:PIN domain nuclease of toxin-antitoxin system
MTVVLLDTHVLIWALDEPERLPRATHALLIDPATDVRFSAASIWEVAIKAALGRGDFLARPADIIRMAQETGFAELPVTARTAALVADLPLHHGDPFDRLLVAQAIVERARLLTADRKLAAYTDLVTLIRPLPARE